MRDTLVIRNKILTSWKGFATEACVVEWQSVNRGDDVDTRFVAGPVSTRSLL